MDEESRICAREMDEAATIPYWGGTLLSLTD
jgi:hypothetical protein